MKIGIGIGWPNSTSRRETIYKFPILDCKGVEVEVWSFSPQFLPGAYVYKDSGLINPFAEAGYWNLAELIFTIGGYEVLEVVKAPLITCPI